MMHSSVIQEELAFLFGQFDSEATDSNATAGLDTFHAWHALDLQDSDLLAEGLDSQPRDVRVVRTDLPSEAVTLRLQDTWGMSPEDTAVVALVQQGALRGGFGQPTEPYALSFSERGLAITVERTGQTWEAWEAEGAPLEDLADYLADCWNDKADDAPVGLVA